MLIATVENLLNRGLPRSPRARELVRELAGRRLAIEVSGMTRIQVESTGILLRLSADAGDSAEARVAGGPFSLLALAGPAAEEVVRRGDVRISGDLQLAGRYRELARLLRPDPEEDLALLIGDVPAHQLARIARTTLGWTRRTLSTAARNAGEYLAHESADLVPRTEGEPFLRSVDRLREDVERLEARLEARAARRRAGSGT